MPYREWDPNSNRYIRRPDNEPDYWDRLFGLIETQKWKEKTEMPAQPQLETTAEDLLSFRPQKHRKVSRLLSEEDKLLLELRQIHGMTYKELSERFDMSRTSLMKRSHRAQQKLIKEKDIHVDWILESGIDMDEIFEEVSFNY